MIKPQNLVYLTNINYLSLELNQVLKSWLPFSSQIIGTSKKQYSSTFIEDCTASNDLHLECLVTRYYGYIQLKSSLILLWQDLLQSWGIKSNSC